MKERLKNYLLPLLLIGVLLAGTLLAIPNGIELRSQRPINFAVAMAIVAALYVLIKIDAVTGALLLYASIMSMQIVYSNPWFCYALFALTIFFVFTVERGNIWRSELFYDVLIIIALANFAFQIMQYFHFYFVIHVKDGSLPGLLSNVNETSALYAITAPAFWRRRRWFLVPITVAGLIMSHSYQGVVAVAAVAFLAAMRMPNAKTRLRIIETIIITAILFFIVIKPFNYSNYRDGRLHIWATSIKTAMVKPVVGWGFDQYDKVIPLITSWKYLTPDVRTALVVNIRDKEAFYKAAEKVSDNDIQYFESDEFQQKGKFLQAHNEYVEWFFISGVVGLLLGLCFLLRSLLFSLQNREGDLIPFYGLLSASIVAFFGFSWHIMPLALITTLYIAIIYTHKKVING